MSEGMSCARCGRALKNEKSVQNGMGPTCALKTAKSDSGALLSDQPVLEGVGPLEEIGLVCRRLSDGRMACNVPHVVVHHSPDGFEVGYGGSGPAELALNVLHQLIPPMAQFETAEPRWKPVHGCGTVAVSDAAYRMHQSFKWDFVAPMPPSGGRVPIEVIRAWIAKNT